MMTVKLHLYSAIVLIYLVGSSLSLENNCTQEHGVIPPDQNGSCPANTEWIANGECCKCLPGSYRFNSCTKEGESCTSSCLPCYACEKRHREYKKDCSLDGNSICGKCEIGFYEPGIRGRPNAKCLKCAPGQQSPQCLGTLVEDNTRVPLAEICDEDKGQFYRHWDGQCPSGTTWKSNIRCCESCYDCINTPIQWGVELKDKSVLCEKDQNQFYKHWDRQCPSGTVWNPDSLCCERHDPYGYRHHSYNVLSTTQRNQQADKPGTEPVCKSVLNDFPPFENLQCPSGTVFDETSQCCHGCPDCGPGWKRNEDCIGGCSPCPNRFYSLDSKNNLECFPCSNCAHLNRKELFECVPVKDTECGSCLPGFVKNHKKTNITCVKEVKIIPTVKTTTQIVPTVRFSGCDESKGHLLPYWDGSCPQESKLCSESHCCVPSRKCRPGYKHVFQNGCMSSCQPCSRGTFSADPLDNDNCTECVECERLQRNFISLCMPWENAVCGECQPGFYNQYSGNPFVKCIRCADSQNPECQHLNADFFPSTVASKKESLHVDNSKVLHVVPAVLSGVAIVAIACFVVYLIIRKMKKRFAKNSKDQLVSINQQESFLITKKQANDGTQDVANKKQNGFNHPSVNAQSEGQPLLSGSQESSPRPNSNAAEHQTSDPDEPSNTTSDAKGPGGNVKQYETENKDTANAMEHEGSVDQSEIGSKEPIPEDIGTNRDIMRLTSFS